MDDRPATALGADTPEEILITAEMLRAGKEEFYRTMIDRDYLASSPTEEDVLACTRFRRHRVRCFDGTGGVSWRGGSSHESSSLRRCA